MTSARPPVLATWLLERFCADDALAGDLIEEFGQQRSGTWYWKQAIIAMSVYSTKEIVEHKWLAVRAILTGWAVWFVCNNVLLHGVLHPWMDALALTEHSIAARIWTVHGRTTYLLLTYVLWVANGWLIARLHRPYQTAMVLAYVLFALAASVPSVYPLAIGALDDPSVRAPLVWEVATRGLTIVSLLFGGLLSTCGAQAFASRHGGLPAPHMAGVDAHGLNRLTH